MKGDYNTMGIKNDLEDLLLVIQIKQKKYRYSLMLQTDYNPKKKCLYTFYNLTKWHIEVREDIDTGKNKRTRVKDENIQGNLTELLLYMVDELKAFGIIGGDTG